MKPMKAIETSRCMREGEMHIFEVEEKNGLGQKRKYYELASYERRAPESWRQITSSESFEGCKEYLDRITITKKRKMVH